MSCGEINLLFVDAVDIKILEPSLILYGKGNRLVLLDLFIKRLDGENVQICKKTYDKIHKISYRKRSESNYQVACAAGREVLHAEIVDKKIQSSFVTKVSDWISNISILSNGSVVVVTSHNLAALLSITDQKGEIKDKLRCEENSTLYCSFIYGNEWENLQFFGGTALGELVVWTKASGIIYRQFLHNGVIFSIDFNGRFLLTSSDDRSIKIFDVNKDEKQFQLTERNQLFGHTSRVFVSKVIQFRNEDFFLSAGEDSNICVWSSNGELMCKKNVCFSGIIWNLDYCPVTEKVVTCSSIGKLDSFELSEILFEEHRWIELENGCDPVKLRFLSNGVLVVLDSKMNIHMKVDDKFVKINHPENQLKFVAIEVFEERIFLAAKNSVIIFDYCNEKKLLEYSCEIKVTKLTDIGYLRSLHAVTKNEILICDLNGLCCVIDIKLHEIKHSFQVPKSAEPWTTSVEKVDDFWLIGDRVGNLFLFDGSETSKKAIEPVQKLSKLHGQLGVTVIKSEGNGIIKTCGNDGTKKTLFLDTSKSPPTIEVFRSERTSINWIEKLRVYNGLEYLLGFNDNYFVIHNNRQIVNEFNCGGRHRHWDLFVVNNQKAVFVYIQKRKLNFVEFRFHNSNLNSIDSPSWHTKECNAVEIVGDLMISGGEDTILRISRIKEVGNQMKLEEIAIVCSHISSIKSITTAKVDEDLLIFSAGGRGQINVTRVIKSHVKEELNFLLSKPQNNSDADFNPETRFTDLFFDEAIRNLFTVSSDGFIRIFEYKENNFKIISEHFYGKCLMKVHVIDDLIFTMATDGFVVFWVRDESSVSLKLVTKIKHNQSGINCFDVFKHSKNFYSIATSGDDMNVIVTDIEIDGTEVTVMSTVSNHQLHIAQVTGIKFIEPNVLCTTSIDQTICKLRVENKKISLLQRSFTCIPDVKGLFFFDKRFIGVFGAGLEFVPAFL